MTMLETKAEIKMALAKAHEDPESYQLMETLVDNYFGLVKHLRETSLYDVLEYEKRITNGTVEPMKILAYENERLKKEINKLRRTLGKTEKYREN